MLVEFCSSRVIPKTNPDFTSKAQTHPLEQNLPRYLWVKSLDSRFAGETLKSQRLDRSLP